MQYVLSKPELFFSVSREIANVDQRGHCNANEKYYSITYPGISDLSTISEDNLATSYICLQEFATRAAKSRVLSLVE